MKPTPGQERALTELLSDQPFSAVMIGKGNGFAGTKTVLDALSSGRAFAVVCKAWYLAADFDQSDGIERAYKLRTDLEAIGINKVVIAASGGPGRAHLWARTHRQAEAVVLAKKHGADVRAGEGGRIRPLGAPHRSGSEQTLLSHATWDEAFATLSGDPSPDELSMAKVLRNREKTEAAKGEPRYLQPRTELEQRFRIGWAKGDRSTGLIKLAGDCKREGWSEGEFIATVLAYPFGAGAKAIEKRSGPRRWLARYIWAKADPDRGGHSPEFLAEIRAIKAAANSWTPPPRYAGLATSLYKVIEIFEKAGVFEGHLSLSAIEKGALIGKNTATRHRKRMVEYGWLEKVKGKSGGYADVYRLKVPDGLVLNGETLSDTPLKGHPDDPKGVLEFPCYVSAQDEALKGIYGAALYRCNIGRLILRELVAGDLNSREIAKKTGRKVGAVNRVLDRLLDWGLVAYTDGVWSSLVTGEGLEQLAKDRGYAGRADMIKRDCERRTDGYRQWLIERAERCGRPWYAKKIQAQLQYLNDRPPKRWKPDRQFVAAT